MQLAFRQAFLSIASFPTVEVPAFTLLTGPNGAGKSHLLQAIENGSVATNVATANSPAQEIRRFDWNSLVPQDTGAFTSDMLRNERSNYEQQYRNLRQHPHAQEPLRNVARSHNLPHEFIQEPYRLAALKRAALEKLLADPAQAPAVLDQIQAACSQTQTWIFQQTDANMQAAMLSVASAAKAPLAAISPETFSASVLPSWGRTDLFQQSFGRLFVAYRDAALANSLAEFHASKGRQHAPFLTEEKFAEVYGPPPWEFVNATVHAAGLDFTINHPDLHDYGPYTPQLTKSSTGVTVPFTSLSSGEKILLSFAFCVYYANDRRQLSVYPKLLLFDEIDAPLHPSMTRSLIDTITGTLVSTFDIKVIAATHSPSTVALAPEGAVHVMDPKRPGLHPVSKAQALNILTVGVPTIAISFDGRRQVFVESPADAKTYDALYKVLKVSLAAERSLEFIATGTRSSEGQETNTGCDVVQRLVAQLSEAGNQSVFGLVDWDGKNNESDRILVLGNSTRNGLENFLLDPLLLLALICREFGEHKAAVGLASDLTYPSLLRVDGVELQSAATAIGEVVFGDAPTTTDNCSYNGGFALQLDRRWLMTDDHALEQMVLAKFPFLHSV